MTLKERILSMKPSITKEDLERVNNSESSKRFRKFLCICEILNSQMDLSNTVCNSYKDVFELIEKYHIDISNIIPADEYQEYKRLMIEDRVQMSPPIGKEPDKVYDFSKEEDRLEYLRINGKVQF